VKNAADCSKQFTRLLKALGHVSPPSLPDGDDPIAVMVMSFLMWDSTTDKALAAYERIRSAAVDFNELRVCLSNEVVEILGPRYPNVIERADRLRAALHDLFLREHKVSFEPLKAQGKRDAKKYIETLDGMVPYVASRLELICFDAHTVPADAQLCTALASEGAADADTSPADMISWLSRQVKSGDALATHQALQSWVDRGAPTGGKGGRRSQAASSKKRSRKTTAKATE
jgi:hypothetical protein